MPDTRGGKVIAGIHQGQFLLSFLLLFLVAWSAVQLKDIGVDNSVEVWFPSSDPALLEYRAFQDFFGNDEQVIIGVQTSVPLLSVEGLKLAKTLTEQVEQVEGIASAVSITNLPVIDDASTAFNVQSIEEMGLSDETVQLLRTDANLKQLLGSQPDVMILLAQMEHIADMDSVRDSILLRLRQALEDSQQEIHYGGIGIIYAALNQASTVGAALFIVVSYGLIALLLWVLFRKVGPMLLTLMSVGVSATILMGFFVASGRSINMVNMILPTLTLVIGVSGCVHMLIHIAQSKQEDPLEKVKDGVGFVFWPCLFNTITTCLGFLALGAADLPVIQGLGVFGALGLFIAFCCGVLCCSIAGKSSFFLPRVVVDGAVHRLISSVAQWGQNHSNNVLMIALLVTLLSGIGISRLKVDTFSIGFFKDGHIVPQDSAWLEEHYGSYTPIEFVVTAPSAHLAETLRSLEAWQEQMQIREDIGYIRGLVQPLRQLHSALTSQPEASLPADAEAIEQLLFLYEMAPDSDLDVLLQRQGEDILLRTTVGIPMLSAKGFARQIEELQALASFPDDVQLRPSGYIPLYVEIMDLIVRSQLSSFALAFVVIFLSIGVLFRSFRMVILSVPANLLPVTMTLGLMGLLGIRLDVATVTIAAIVLGLVVDDTVQFLYRLHYEQRQTTDIREAVLQTVIRVGQPMFITTVVLALGFSVLGLASVTSIAYFGLLLAFALVSALFSDLLVLPALLIAMDDTDAGSSDVNVEITS